MSLEPLYKVIYTDLLNAIQSGEYAPGSTLPSEKKLSELYNVSRITSKKALEMLADRDYVMRKPGKGTFVLSSDGSLKNSEKTERENTEEASENSLPMIGVILDSINETFGGEILRGIEYEARRRGFLMNVAFTYGSQEEETRMIQRMYAAGAKGIILMCVQEETINEEILKLHLNGFPMILVDREIKGISIPVVATDNYRASCELTQKLIDAGHTRIGFISHSGFRTSTVNARFEGFRDTMLANGLLTDESMWLRDLNEYLPTDDEDENNLQQEKTEDEILTFLNQNPEITALYIMEAQLAGRVYDILYRRNIEMELAFFDGPEEVIAPAPLFKHVIQEQYQIGVTSVRLLAHKIRGEEVKGQVEIPYRLIDAVPVWPKR